jgi:hypothetical protein
VLALKLRRILLGVTVAVLSTTALVSASPAQAAAPGPFCWESPTDDRGDIFEIDGQPAYRPWSCVPDPGDGSTGQQLSCDLDGDHYACRASSSVPDGQAEEGLVIHSYAAAGGGWIEQPKPPAYYMCKADYCVTTWYFDVPRSQATGGIFVEPFYWRNAKSGGSFTGYPLKWTPPETPKPTLKCEKSNYGYGGQGQVMGYTLKCWVSASGPGATGELVYSSGGVVMDRETFGGALIPMAPDSVLWERPVQAGEVMVPPGRDILFMPDDTPLNVTATLTGPTGQKTTVSTSFPCESCDPRT